MTSFRPITTEAIFSPTLKIDKRSSASKNISMTISCPKIGQLTSLILYLMRNDANFFLSSLFINDVAPYLINICHFFFYPWQVASWKMIIDIFIFVALALGIHVARKAFKKICREYQAYLVTKLSCSCKFTNVTWFEVQE